MISVVSCTISLLHIMYKFTFCIDLMFRDFYNIFWGHNQESSSLQVELNIKGNGRWVPIVELESIRFTSDPMLS